MNFYAQIVGGAALSLLGTIAVYGMWAIRGLAPHEQMAEWGKILITALLSAGVCYLGVEFLEASDLPGTFLMYSYLAAGMIVGAIGFSIFGNS